MTEHTPETLRAFEADIAAEFNAGNIRAPIHLSGGNESVLIDLFSRIEPRDWVFSTWRSHYHCLLKGVDPVVLKRDIMAGRSITLNYPDQRIVSSAIVGGTLPIALGVAWSIRHKALAGDPQGDMVWVFVGDMAASTGAFNECMRYAEGHDLPIRFIIEDNGLSVCTNTRSAWGGHTVQPAPVTRYRYTLPWPHSGAGKRINF